MLGNVHTVGVNAISFSNIVYLTEIADIIRRFIELCLIEKALIIAEFDIDSAVFPIMKQGSVEFIDLFASVLATKPATCHSDLHALLEGDNEIRRLILIERLDYLIRDKSGKVFACIEAVTNLGGTDLIKWRKDNKGVSKFSEQLVFTKECI